MIRKIVPSGERGISSVLVAVSLMAILGAAMLSVDAGNLWQTRRSAVTSTDAAALRAANDVITDPMLVGGTSCGSNWPAALANNTAADVTQPQSTCQVFRPYPNSIAGYVTVAGTFNSQSKFGGVVGIGDQRPFSSTSVMFGYVTSVSGLRPIGICQNNHHIQEWLSLRAGLMSQAAYDALPTTEPNDTNYHPPRVGHPSYPGLDGHVIHRIWFDKNPAKVDGCPNGKTPGNWAFLDFNGGNNATADLVDWFLNGYSGEVSINDCNSDGTLGDSCAGNPGFSGGGGSTCPKNPNSLEDALNCLKDKEFPILLYSTADCPTNGGGGGGSNCQFDAWQFLFVNLRGWNIGSSGSTASTYFDFEFTSSIVKGKCCGLLPTGPDTGVFGMKICSVDHDTTLAAVHCTPT